MTTVLLDALVPIFVGLLLGYLAGRRGLMDNVNVRNLIVLVMNFAIPCALFSTILRTSRADLEQQIPTALMITLVFTALYAASYIWARQSLKLSVSDASVLALTIGFPNSAAVALPLFAASYGSASSVTAALSIAVGAITISPLTVALLEADKQSQGAGISLGNVLRSFVRALARPVVWAPALALVGAYFGVHLPSYANRTLMTLGSAATGSALILTGVVVSAQRFRFNKAVLWTTVAILLVQPLFALGMTLLFHMSRDHVRDITIISAIPGGFFGLVFGKSFDATPETASSGLIASYGAGWLTLAVWMLVMAKYF
ncbi:AEC family transporter [Granulicella mallensis]|uniref:Auxin Efflux Carrier n=1 Tax=Granulicella mallensis (strain ATCC BAA-1857 / DSM 23137 / MP5ACTX8) TaxID=682795 RepID=G8NWE3_GRAMM|nr:AEC family transporter [Granulicella mallensis]AEU37746.1 Auxin Efflux Carrier [Granulicella mallensis MP5ACTX8]